MVTDSTAIFPAKFSPLASWYMLRTKQLNSFLDNGFMRSLISALPQVTGNNNSSIATINNFFTFLLAERAS
jgi:hypothetical protein